MEKDNFLEIQHWSEVLKLMIILVIHKEESCFRDKFHSSNKECSKDKKHSKHSLRIAKPLLAPGFRSPFAFIA